MADYSQVSASHVTNALSSNFTSSNSEAISTLQSQFRGVSLSTGDFLAKAGLPPRWVGIVRSGSIRQTYLDNFNTLRKYDKDISSA